MKDLEDKYTRMLRRMNGEDPELMAWDMLEDESLPFTERVKAYPMPDKFKMPRIEKYNGSGDPQDHLEAFKEHIILKCEESYTPSVHEADRGVHPSGRAS
jgi:hypothetical protein